MELRTINPRSLIDNPDNPRGKAAPDHADEQMRLSIAAVGILQPPVVREMPKGLTVRYGSRRVRAALALKLDQIEVLVLGEHERADDDQIRAVLENIVRKPMSVVAQWRSIEKLVDERWTEEAISNVLVLPVRTIRKLRLLANILPAVLDRMHAGDMPKEPNLRVIASASQEEQAAAWKRHKPKKGELADWHALAGALSRQEMRAADALFDAAFAEAYGVTYVEDLFAPADEDSRTTTNVDGFLAAQQAWVETHLPENGVMLTAEAYGGVKLPAQAMRHHGPPDAPGVKVGVCLDENTGKVRQVLFTVAAPAPRGGGEAGTDATPDAPASKPRADVTQAGTAMIGHMRTDALHAALQREPIDDGQLIALLVLALAGQNVDVKTGAGQDHMTYGTRTQIAQPVIEGGAITSDPEVLRAAARAMLVHTLSCRENFSNSGTGARIAGAAVGADAHLPSMATQEFLSCLSKKAMEAVAVSLNVRVQPTGKATRLDVISKVGSGRWVYPTAAFADVAGERAREDGPEYRPADDLMSAGDEEDTGDADRGPDLEEDGDDPVMPPPSVLAQHGPDPRAAA
jgi:ParB family chromosome partitioning protein